MKNKEALLIALPILVVVMAAVYYIYSLGQNPYIDIYEDLTYSVDIDLYSVGTGKDEKIYLGIQPTHYQIYKNGKIYEYRESEFRYAQTGKREPAYNRLIANLSKSELKQLESEIREYIKNNPYNKEDTDYISYHVLIDSKEYRVNQGIYNDILNKYL